MVQDSNCMLMLEVNKHELWDTEPAIANGSTITGPSYASKLLACAIVTLILQSFDIKHQYTTTFQLRMAATYRWPAKLTSCTYIQNLNIFTSNQTLIVFVCLCVTKQVDTLKSGNQTWSNIWQTNCQQYQPTLDSRACESAVTSTAQALSVSYLSSHPSGSAHTWSLFLIPNSSLGDHVPCPHSSVQFDVRYPCSVINYITSWTSLWWLLSW